MYVIVLLDADVVEVAVARNGLRQQALTRPRHSVQQHALYHDIETKIIQDKTPCPGAQAFDARWASIVIVVFFLSVFFFLKIQMPF